MQQYGDHVFRQLRNGHGPQFKKTQEPIQTLMRLYESLDVWKRISEKQLVRYRCFKDLASGQYSVQSADFYRLPFEPKQVADLERQHMELFAEQGPEERAGGFASPEAAIEAHDKEFRSSEDGEDDNSSADG